MKLPITKCDINQYLIKKTPPQVDIYRSHFQVSLTRATLFSILQPGFFFGVGIFFPRTGLIRRTSVVSLVFLVARTLTLIKIYAKLTETTCDVEQKCWKLECVSCFRWRVIVLLVRVEI